ncbi:MAG: DUF1893 domain-containing protein [Thermoprotei archaeon]|nr:MAG: DUF1893 domain-containing protein [Thermoprotei archaeon]
MLKEDLKLAKRILNERKLSLVIVKNGTVLYESSASGIVDLVKAVISLKHKMWESSVADKVVGKAAALLLAYSKVKGVFAEVLSESGLRVLAENNIEFEFKKLVPVILDREKRTVCPFERLTLRVQSPEEAYRILRSLV